jgi:pyruvate-ferredoxin/flavodoxin oxidoreductase
LIIAYSHCIAHGFNLSQGLDHQKMAVETGYWPLYRFDPRRKNLGNNSLVLDSTAPKHPLARFTENEIRFRSLHATNPARAKALEERAQNEITTHNELYRRMAEGPASTSADPAQT